MKKQWAAIYRNTKATLIPAARRALPVRTPPKEALLPFLVEPGVALAEAADLDAAATDLDDAAETIDSVADARAAVTPVPVNVRVPTAA